MTFSLAISGDEAFSLTAGDSHNVAFGLVMGGNLAELQANADTMQFIYNNVVLVPTITVSDDTLDFGRVEEPIKA